MSNVDTVDRIKCVLEPETCGIELRPNPELGLLTLIATDLLGPSAAAVAVALDRPSVEALHRELDYLLDAGVLEFWDVDSQDG